MTVLLIYQTQRYVDSLGAIPLWRIGLKSVDQNYGYNFLDYITKACRLKMLHRGGPSYYGIRAKKV